MGGRHRGPGVRDRRRDGHQGGRWRRRGCLRGTVEAVPLIGLDRGWRTDRLSLEPLTVAHAAELAPLLDDARLHEFTGGAPLSAAALTARYVRLAARRSPGGDQMWGNWVLRVRATGQAAGTVQATLPAGGPAAGAAEIAWVVAPAAQGHGYAKE